MPSQAYAVSYLSATVNERKTFFFFFFPTGSRRCFSRIANRARTWMQARCCASRGTECGDYARTVAPPQCAHDVRLLFRGIRIGFRFLKASACTRIAEMRRRWRRDYTPAIFNLLLARVFFSSFFFCGLSPPGEFLFRAGKSVAFGLSLDERNLGQTILSLSLSLVQVRDRIPRSRLKRHERTFKSSEEKEQERNIFNESHPRARWRVDVSEIQFRVLFRLSGRQSRLIASSPEMRIRFPRLYVSCEIRDSIRESKLQSVFHDRGIRKFRRMAHGINPPPRTMKTHRVVLAFLALLRPA